MSIFKSVFATDILSMIDYRVALGHSRYSYETILLKFDKYCCENCPNVEKLTKEVVTSWLENEESNTSIKASTIRTLGKYMTAIGKEAYVLYDKYGSRKTTFKPYIFTDEELENLFKAIDTIKPSKEEPFISEIAPVLYRLIYTCGLRPNEGRELKLENINLKTGEILIVCTKRKKDRIVVMSKDMLDLCNNYIKRREIFSKDSEWLFPSWSGEPLKNRQVGYYFKKCFKVSNSHIKKENLPSVRVYDLRHRFASAVLNRWLDNKDNIASKLSYLRAYMGHNSLSETAYYIHLLPENLLKSSGVDWKALEGIIPEVSLWEE